MPAAHIVTVMVGLTLSCAAVAPSSVDSTRAEPQPPALTPAPRTADSLIPAADIAHDLRIFREAYESMHPGLYRYHTRESLAEQWGALESIAQRDASLRDVYLALSRFSASLKCGHAYANFYNQSKAIKAALLQGDNRVPFRFRWLDDRMIVTANDSDDPRLVPGSRVLSINGTPAESILAKLLPLVRADGGNDAKRRALLSVQGKDEYETFDVFFPLVFPPAGPSFDVRFTPPGATEPLAAVLKPLSFDARAAAAKARMPDTRGDQPVWSFRNDGHELAILTMPGWALYNSKWDWRSWLDQQIDRVIAEGTPNLVIDLRGNEGGLDCGNPLAARLTERDLPLPQKQRFVRYRRVPDSLKNVLDTWDDSFRDWGEVAKPVPTPAAVAHGEQSFFILSDRDADADARFIRPKGPRYTGRVFVLVDATCSSATFGFAAMVKEHRLGTLVGQTTGGNQRGINGGAFFFLRLPRTGIEVDLPLIAAFADPQTPNAGIVPDVPVQVTPADIAAGVDAEMSTVRALTARFETGGGTKPAPAGTPQAPRGNP